MHLAVCLAAISDMCNTPTRYLQTIMAQGCEWQLYINNMSSQGTWWDNIIIQSVSDALSCVVYVTHAFPFVEQPIMVYPWYDTNRDAVAFRGFIPEVHKAQYYLILKNNTFLQFRNFLKLFLTEKVLLSIRTSRLLQRPYTLFCKKILMKFPLFLSPLLSCIQQGIITLSTV